MSLLAATADLDENDSVLLTFADHIIDPMELNRFKVRIRELEEQETPVGCILTFDSEITEVNSVSPWSHVQLDSRRYDAKSVQHDHITSVVEKIAISPIATCGMYYIPSWFQFREAIMSMCTSNTRAAIAPYFVAPAFSFCDFPVEEFRINAKNFHSLGTVDRYHNYISGGH